MNHYSQLTSQQRTTFQILKGLGHRMVDIAKEIGVHFSTLYRETGRNQTSDKKYEALHAQQRAQARKAIPRSPTKCTVENRDLIEAKLREDWSPDVISGRFQREPEGPQLSPNTIYKIIEQDRNQGGQLFKLLPHRGRGYRKNRTGPQRKGKLQTRPGQEIGDRPASIQERQEPGHVEIDLMFSGQTIWLTWVDRYSRKINLRALSSKESGPIALEVELLFRQEKIRSITTDRGLEWSQLNPGVLDAINGRTERLNLYFCNAYCSWEKGSIENANRLLRRYLPKGKNLPWNDERWLEAHRIAELMNQRPRKILGYRTPLEVEREWNATRRKAAWKKSMAPRRAEPQAA